MTDFILVVHYIYVCSLFFPLKIGSFDLKPFSNCICIFSFALYFTCLIYIFISDHFIYIYIYICVCAFLTWRDPQGIDYWNVASFYQWVSILPRGSRMKSQPVDGQQPFEWFNSQRFDFTHSGHCVQPCFLIANFIIIYSRVFHTSFSRWFFTRVWVTASLFSVFWPILAML